VDTSRDEAGRGHVAHGSGLPVCRDASTGELPRLSASASIFVECCSVPALWCRDVCCALSKTRRLDASHDHSLTHRSGITRTSRTKRSKSGAAPIKYRKKRKFELGRPAAMTKLGPKRVHVVRVRGGNEKRRAMRLDTGNFAWASEHATKKTRIIGVVYNASNNELVRTNTLVKGCVIQVDATPFRQWYEAHYGQPVTRRGKQTAPAEDAKPPSARVQARSKDAKVDPLLESQFQAGRLYAVIGSRPGQSGRADGYILEGQELQFYLRRLRAAKGKHAQ